MAPAGNGGLRARLEEVLKAREDQKRTEGDLEKVADISQLRRKFQEARKNPRAAPETVEVASLSVLRRKFQESARRCENLQRHVDEEEIPVSTDSTLEDILEATAVESDESPKVRKSLFLLHIWRIKFPLLA